MPVGPLTKKYLEKVGYRADQIEKMHGGTRLFHDMGVFGDNADEELDLLRTEFFVDISTLPARKYYPDQAWTWDSFVSAFFWNTQWGERVKSKYPALTLDMIERALEEKKWIFD